MRGECTTGQHVGFSPDRLLLLTPYRLQQHHLPLAHRKPLQPPVAFMPNLVPLTGGYGDYGPLGQYRQQRAEQPSHWVRPLCQRRRAAVPVGHLPIRNISQHHVHLGPGQSCRHSRAVGGVGAKEVRFDGVILHQIAQPRLQGERVLEGHRGAWRPAGIVPVRSGGMMPRIFLLERLA